MLCGLMLLALLFLLLFFRLPVLQNRIIQTVFENRWTWHISQSSCVIILILQTMCMRVGPKLKDQVHVLQPGLEARSNWLLGINLEWEEEKAKSRRGLRIVFPCHWKNLKILKYINVWIPTSVKLSVLLQGRYVFALCVSMCIYLYIYLFGWG